MPMWITWVNPRTQKRERIYNYHDADSPEGSMSIQAVKTALSSRFHIPIEKIPGFFVEDAEWIASGARGYAPHDDTTISGLVRTKSTQSARKRAETPNDTPRMKILCIDDAPDILEVLDLTIKIKWPDWQVLTAEDGPAGLALFDEENPDLVIVDLGMPEMDGYEVIRRLRRRSSVPIIILTVRDDEESMAQGFDVGADDYMVKPFGQMELTGRIQAVLRRTSQEQNDRG